MQIPDREPAQLSEQRANSLVNSLRRTASTLAFLPDYEFSATLGRSIVTLDNLEDGVSLANILSQPDGKFDVNEIFDKTVGMIAASRLLGENVTLLDFTPVELQSSFSHGEIEGVEVGDDPKTNDFVLRAPTVVRGLTYEVRMEDGSKDNGSDHKFRVSHSVVASSTPDDIIRRW